MNIIKSDPQYFQQTLLHWFDQHGRKHLPWQKNKTPYRVWISEIMLQQTQVSTVIPYFEKFMQVFPRVELLAKAALDDVLHLWTGLGYYSRARNLHRAANMIVNEFKGKFPDNLVDLQELPGIGKSTASAILSIAFNQQTAILDGNVKRVLSRFQGIITPINEKNTEAQLWQIAEQFMPPQRCADYTQAIMDLGATLCIRGKPGCDSCPLASHCIAQQQGIAPELPKKKASKALPVRTTSFLILQKGRQLLLRKRPASGIWGGLWSFPEISDKATTATIRRFCQDEFALTIDKFNTLPAFRHSFTHFHLDIHPIIVPVKGLSAKNMAAAEQIWYNPDEPPALGLPRPVQSIIGGLS